MNVGIIGLGYVGLTLGVISSLKNYNVYGIEKNPDVLNKLNNEKKSHFFEPGLNTLIENHLNQNFFVSKEFDLKIEFDTFIITVGTPLKNNSNQPNFEHIKDALKTIEKVYNGTQLVILRSTVSVGVTEEIVIPMLARNCKN